jgi:WD40 repeat protein
VRVWSLDRVREELRLEHGYSVRAVEFTHDGEYLASLGDEEVAVQLWNSKTGYRTATLEHENLVVSFGMSSDGRSIATASHDGSVATWDIASAEPRLRLVHEGLASGAAYSADGAWLVTWSAWEQTARVWDAVTGAEIARVAHDAAVTAAEFSPDGRWLLTASEDGSVRVWKWRADDVVAEICSRVTRNLTPDEWRRFVGEEPYRPTCPNIR